MIGIGARAEPSLRNHPQLLALTIALPIAEAGLLWSLGLATAVPLAPQVTAAAPFGSFHDLRWLLVYHPSWAVFAGGAVAVVALRSGLVAFTVRAAWPLDEEPPPPVPQLLARSTSFTLAAEILLLPFAALLFALAVAPVSWIFFAGLPGAVAVALLTHHGVTRSRWWRDAPPLRGVGWIALSFGVLTLAGAALSATPPALGLPVAAAAGLFNAWAWLGIVRTVVGRARPPLRPVAPVALALVITAAVLGVLIGLAGHQQTTRLRGEAHRIPPSDRPVLVVAGFNSSWDGSRPDDVLGAGFFERRFSYRGLDAEGRPLTYEPRHTHQPLPDLVRKMAHQVRSLRSQSGRDVDIVAESEGSVIAAAYGDAFPGGAVHRVVLLSPLVEPGRVSFPERGADGWGVATGWVLRGTSASIHTLTGVELAPDSPFVRSLVDGAPMLRDILSCRWRGAGELALLPLADAVVSPRPSAAVEFGVSVIPAFHGSFLDDATVGEAVALGLRRHRLPDLTVWSGAQRVVSAASAGWQVPTLPITLGWDVDHAPDCREARARLQQWLRPGFDPTPSSPR